MVVFIALNLLYWLLDNYFSFIGHLLAFEALYYLYDLNMYMLQETYIGFWCSILTSSALYRNLHNIVQINKGEIIYETQMKLCNYCLEALTQ